MSYPVAVVNKYLDACCFNPNPSKFYDLLDDNVTLVLSSEEEKNTNKKTFYGKKYVVLIYKHYFFNVTSEIKLTSFSVNTLSNDSVLLTMQGDSTKENFKGKGKCHLNFDRAIKFKISKKDDQDPKICKIKNYKIIFRNEIANQE